jgi:D-sedoheptulose 7-phosphate isomerase
VRKIVFETIAEHKAAVAEFEKNGVDIVIAIAEMITAALESGGCVYLCGNGGSAADCQHIAGEFIGRFRRERRALPAVALSTDTSILTCLGNDYGFDEIFSRQVEGLATPGDILWAFSTSGSSRNVVKAARLARDIGAKVIAFTGKADSELEGVSDLCLCAATQQTSTAQEVHLLAYHIICDLVEQDVTNRP